VTEGVLPINNSFYVFRLLEKYRVVMETYVSPFVSQVVQLYGSLNQFSYDIGKTVNNKYFYDCLIQVQEELVYGHKVVKCKEGFST
jgi:hypothetical protein